MTIFTNKNGAAKPTCYKLQLNHAQNLPKELQGRDLFGMGYPYHIRLYAEQLMVITSDYGVLFLQVEGLK